MVVARGSFWDSNAYELWKRIGAPQPPPPARQEELKKAGKLQTLGPPVRAQVERGRLRLTFELPRQAVSLVTVHY